MTATSPVQSISAVTLVTADMVRSVAFYEVLGFEHLAATPAGDFTTFRVGHGFLNLQLDPTAVADERPGRRVWGRIVFWVDDVDALHRRAVEAGLHPETEPADAPWGERYFHLRDPDGHELSFARPIRPSPTD